MKSATKKLSALLLAVCMLTVLPMSALALSDNPSESTVDVVAAADEMQNNYGTINKNLGTVENNFGTVTENSGTIKKNYGTVVTNAGLIEKQYYPLTIQSNLDVKITDLINIEQIDGKLWIPAEGGAIHLKPKDPALQEPSAYDIDFDFTLPAGCTVAGEGPNMYGFHNVTGPITINVTITPLITEEPIPETGDSTGIFFAAGAALLSLLGMALLPKKHSA